ncbi:MAG: carbonic anhydrase, partial [Actinomycetota bacterium]
VINHTDCGMLTFEDDQLVQQLESETGIPAVAPVHFHAFKDVKNNVRRQVERIRNHPWIPASISVRGFVYDVKTGRLEEVATERAVRKTA